MTVITDSTLSRSRGDDKSWPDLPVADKFAVYTVAWFV
jgi:hypothetical protein